jgi:ABC-2 type transport system permease protein
MNRMMAIVERELRKFLRSPALMLISMVFPLVQLVVLGNAFGGKIHDAKFGVVDYDAGPEALMVREALDSIRANAGTITPVLYSDDKTMLDDVRRGKLQGGLIIPAQFSRRVYSANHPQIALVLDNTDTFMSSTLAERMQQLVAAMNQPQIEPRLVQQLTLEIVELYPYVEYMRYLLPGVIVLAMFVSVMIGGGIVYIDDKARGVHEGYLVTPISKLELVLGLNLAGSIKAILSGLVLTMVGSLIVGINIFRPAVLLQSLVLIACTSVAFVSMISMMMARVEDPLVPRATFGVLNTLLYFPSGAIYPIKAFPAWLRAIATVNPFTYAVHGFKALLLRDVGITAIWQDLLYLVLFATVMLALTNLLFKRTL